MSMTNGPLVSVIIIFLNAERFLEEAVASVFAQSYPDWELLLCDDGSTDGSSAIGRRLAAEQPGRVRYLEHSGHRNRGMSATRNLGIGQARGEYLAFLDADDVWLPEKLAQQVALLAAHPEAAMVYGRSEWWYSWTGNSEDQDKDHVYELGVPAGALLRPPILLRRFFLDQTAAIPGPTNIMVRREIMQSLVGFEERFKGPYEDQAFYTKLCLRWPVIASEQVWDRYRQHPDSRCAIVEEAGQAREARLFFLGWLAHYVSTHAADDKKLLRDIRRAETRLRNPTVYRQGARMRRLAARRAASFVLRAVKAVPVRYRRRLRARLQGTDYCPPPGSIWLGSLRRVTPLSRQFGFDRGSPVDRYYIEQFLGEHAEDVRGNVLEIGDSTYSRRFGGCRVTTIDVLHAEDDGTVATIIGDLTCPDSLPANTFDCVILTQTLQFIFDVSGALRTINRSLKPGGVVLATVPGISQISRYDAEKWGHYWSFTSMSAKKLFAEAFPCASIELRTYGNVLAASGFLYGIASQELQPGELNHRDPDYELIIAIRARKPADGEASQGARLP